MDTYIENLMWRYATKKFDPTKKLSSAETDMLEEALRLAPNSYGLQAWKFYRADNPETRAAIREAAYGQPQTTDASHLYVLTAKTAVTKEDIAEFIDSIKSVRGVGDEVVADYRKIMEDDLLNRSSQDVAEWTKRQVYIALGFLLSAAAQHRIDACPMEGFNPAKVTEIIGADKEGYEAAALCAVGHRAPDDPFASLKKVRYPKERILKIV